MTIKRLQYCLMAAGLLLMACAITSCGGTSLDKVVKKTLLAGDTTETAFGEICQVIKADTRKYAEFLGEDGEVNVAALGEYINMVGESLRPARHWNVSAYGQHSLSLGIYLERSGSMTAYDTQGGGGELKKVVNDLINFFPAGDKSQPYGNVKISIVNDGIYAYEAPVADFLKDKNIYASTATVGDARYTDFQQILTTILSHGSNGEVSVLVSDMIYSPKDTKDVSSEKIFNEVNSLATGVFRQFPDKAAIITKVRGSYHGAYYPYNGASYRYDGARPFYVMVIADRSVIDRISADEAYSRFLNVAGAEATYRFNQPQSEVSTSLLASWEGSKGRFRVSREGALKLEHCEADRATGVLRFSLAANLGSLGKDDAFLCDAANYSIESAGNFKVEVKPIDPASVNGNMKSYLEGKTHVITLTGRLDAVRDHITLRLMNAFPAWIDESSSNDDSNPADARFATSTFALKPFMRGIYDAYAQGGDAYATITVDIEK